MGVKRLNSVLLIHVYPAGRKYWKHTHSPVSLTSQSIKRPCIFKKSPCYASYNSSHYITNVFLFHNNDKKTNQLRAHVKNTS
uniref:Uncharacterized protein n=1 Tax=Anguilla anguilla TaxID=7936 RepID=A0A0E9X9G5_ANGAN